APGRRDEPRGVVMALAELDLEVEGLEEGRRRVEHDPVRAGARLAELRDAPVVVGDAVADEVTVGVEELDAHARCRAAALGIEDVGGEGHSCHSLRACLRCSAAISCSPACTSSPPRTTSAPA